MKNVNYTFKIMHNFLERLGKFITKSKSAIQTCMYYLKSSVKEIVHFYYINKSFIYLIYGYHL